MVTHETKITNTGKILFILPLLLYHLICQNGHIPLDEDWNEFFGGWEQSINKKSK